MMLVHRISVGIVLILGTSIAACSRPEAAKQDVAANATSASERILGFQSSQSCGKPAMRAPAVGARFVYTMLDAAGADVGLWTDEIVRSEGDVAAARSTLTLPDLGDNDAPGSAYLAGVLPATGAGPNPRIYELPENASRLVGALKPGETVELQGSETSTIKGALKTVQGVVTVTLTGCGAIDVENIKVPVHVYDVVTFRRAVTRASGPGADMVKSFKTKIYSSDAVGWPVASEDGGGLMRAKSIPKAL